METFKTGYKVTIEHSKYVAGIIGSNPLIKNRIVNPMVKLFNDDKMCQSLEPLLPSGLFTKRNIVKFVGVTCGTFIIYRATKTMASEINKRYLRAKHWFKIYAWSATHPELYLLVEFHSLVSPFIYFHYLFKFSWSILQSYHKQRMHSSINYKVSKWRTLITLLKVTCLLGGSALYWFGFTPWSNQQIFGRNLSFHSWATKKALKSIDVEEIIWKKAVRSILSDHFGRIDALSEVVIEFVGYSDVFKDKQDMLKGSVNLSNHNYVNDRRRAYRSKYTRQFKQKKNVISCFILSGQAIGYVFLLYKAINCENKERESYYDKVDNWHDQFDDGYDVRERWRIETWINKTVMGTWTYLFVDRRIPFSKYIVVVTNYISSVNVKYMDRDTRRFWRNVTFYCSMCGLWGWLNYAIVEEITYSL